MGAGHRLAAEERFLADKTGRVAARGCAGVRERGSAGAAPVGWASVIRLAKGKGMDEANSRRCEHRCLSTRSPLTRTLKTTRTRPRACPACTPTPWCGAAATLAGEGLSGWSGRDGGGSRRRGGERLEMVGKGLASVGGRALVALALVGVCCGQTFKIYQGGTAKWCAAPRFPRRGVLMVEV